MARAMAAPWGQGQKTVLTDTLCVRLSRKRGGDGVGPGTSPSHSLADRGSVRHVTVISAAVRFVGMTDKLALT